MGQRTCTPPPSPHTVALNPSLLAGCLLQGWGGGGTEDFQKVQDEAALALNRAELAEDRMLAVEAQVDKRCVPASNLNHIHLCKDESSSVQIDVVKFWNTSPQG